MKLPPEGPFFLSAAKIKKRSLHAKIKTVNDLFIKF